MTYPPMSITLTVRPALSEATIRAHFRAVSDSHDKVERDLRLSILEAEVVRILRWRAQQQREKSNAER